MNATATAFAADTSVDAAVPLDAFQVIAAGDRLCATQGPQQAAALYQQWLAGSTSPMRHVVQFNLGVTLSQLEQLPAILENKRATAAAPAGAAAAACAALALWPGRLWRAPNLSAWWAVLHALIGLWLLTLAIQRRLSRGATLLESTGADLVVAAD